MQDKNGGAFWPLHANFEIVYHQKPTVLDNRPLIHKPPEMTMGANLIKEKGPGPTFIDFNKSNSSFMRKNAKSAIGTR